MSTLTRAVLVFGFTLLCLGLMPSSAADAKGHPTIIRGDHYVCAMGKKGDALSFRLNCRRHSDEPTGVSFMVIEPDSEVLREGVVPLGEQREFSYPLRKDGIHIIALECAGNTYDIAIETLPWAYLASKEHKFHACGRCRRLYFLVPKGAKQFSIFVCAETPREGALIKIFHPDGEIAREEEGDYDRETELKLEVPPGKDGKVWSITVEDPPAKDLNLDDVVLYLSPEIRPFASEREDWAPLFTKE